MILTAGLTPAWQQILVFDHFRGGEVNRAAEAHWCASGKVFNAGIAVHRLGGPSLTLSVVGGPSAREIEREFTSMGVPHRFLTTASATRVCTTILDRGAATTTELVENGRPLSADEQQQFLNAYAEAAATADFAILIGSLPAGVPADLYRQMAQRTPCPIVADVRGEALLELLPHRPLLVKPNREELALTVGRALDDDLALVSAMRSLNDRGAGWVVVTQGKGPVWVTAADAVYRLTPPPVDRVVNAIGCGDALAAAATWALRAGYEPVDAVRWGVAAAGENLRQLFPCRFDPAAVPDRAAGVVVERL